MYSTVNLNNSSSLKKSWASSWINCSSNKTVHEVAHI